MLLLNTRGEPQAAGKGIWEPSFGANPRFTNKAGCKGAEQLCWAHPGSQNHSLGWNLLIPLSCLGQGHFPLVQPSLSPGSEERRESCIPQEQNLPKEPQPFVGAKSPSPARVKDTRDGFEMVFPARVELTPSSAAHLSALTNTALWRCPRKAPGM